MDVDRIECLSKAFRTAGGTSPLTNSAGTFVATERFDDPSVTADRSALPPSNSGRYEVTLSSPYPVCLPCGVTAPAHGHSGGGIECVASPDQFADCSVKDNRTGAVIHQGSCAELADLIEPPSSREGPSLIGIGLGVLGVLAIGGLLGALLSGGTRNRASIGGPSRTPFRFQVPNRFTPPHPPYTLPPYRYVGLRR